jgi:hypothetical protein
MKPVKRNFEIKEDVLFRGSKNGPELKVGTVILDLNIFKGFPYDFTITVDLRYNLEKGLCLYILQGKEILYLALNETDIELPKEVAIISEFKSYKILNGSEILEFYFKEKEGGIVYEALVRQYDDTDLDNARFIHKGVLLNNIEYRLVKQQVKNLKKILKEKR